MCQAKYENDYGIEGKEISYICRPCMDKEHYDVIESAKNAIDSETESDAIVDIYGGNDSGDKAVSNAAEEKSDDNSGNQATRSANEEEKSDDKSGGDQATRSANEEEKSDDKSGGNQATRSVNEEEKSDDNSGDQATRSANEEKSDDNSGDQATQSANEEKSDDISSAAATLKKSGVIAAPKPCASKRGVQKRPTTARNLSTYTKKKKRVRCKKGARVKIRRDNLFHILESEKHKDDVQKYGNSRNFHGGILFLVPSGTNFHLEISHAVHTRLRKY